MTAFIHGDYGKFGAYMGAVAALWLVLWQLLDGPWFGALLVSAGVVELTWRGFEWRSGRHEPSG